MPPHITTHTLGTHTWNLALKLGLSGREGSSAPQWALIASKPAVRIGPLFVHLLVSAYM